MVGAVVPEGSVPLVTAVVTPVVTVFWSAAFGSVTGLPVAVVIVTGLVLVPVCDGGAGVTTSPMSGPVVIFTVVVPPVGSVTVVVTLTTV